MFTHETDGGTVELPPFSQIPFGIIRKLRSEDDAEQLFGLFEKVADDDTLDVIDQMTLENVQELFLAWQKHAEVTLGESEGSAGS